MTPLISGLASVASLLFNASSSGAAKPSASARDSGASPAEPSTQITLSKEAEALSGVAGQSAAASARGVAARSSLASSQGGSVSAESFGELLTQFGATQAQKEQLTAGFDANHDGKISQEEFMKGLGDTSGAKTANSELSQAILQLMDQGGNANGVVDGKEFARFSMAFVAAEKRPA